MPPSDPVRLVDESGDSISTANPLPTTATATLADNAAVEIKDSTTDARVKVAPGNTIVPGDNAMAVAITATPAPPDGTGATEVQGTAAEGAASVGDPVQVGGIDAGGLMRALRVISGGLLGIFSGLRSAAGDGAFNDVVIPYGHDGTNHGLATALWYYTGVTWQRLRGGLMGIFTQGAIADGVATTANPVIVGGKTTGGNARSALFGPTGVAAVFTGGSTTGVDGAANTLTFAADSTGNSYPRVGVSYLFNDTTWDRPRGNTQGTLMPSSARTATTNSSDQTNYNARGVHVILSMTNYGGAGSVTLKIQARDPISGTYYDLLQSAAIVANGLVVLKVYPGIAVAANASASDILPRVWRVRVEHADGTSHTYSVAYALVL